MIKVLHFFKTYSPDTMGGIEQVIFQLAEGGAAYGIAPEVLYLSPRGAARGETVGHHVAHRSKLDLHLASTGLSWSAIGDFAELAEQADVVHYHFPWPFMDVAHFAARIRKPSVVSYHSDVVKQRLLLKLYAPLMHRFLGSVDRIVAASPNYVETSPVLQRHSGRVSVIPYGLDRSTYPNPSPERLDFWRGRLGERFFLFVGALRYYKGLDYLLEAVRGTDMTVAVVGTGLEEQKLHEQVQQPGFGNLHLLGGLPDEDKAALLTLCHAFVFPSHLRSEAFGISLLEGAMYGKALISCEIGTGTTFINVADETGLVVPPRDSSALRQAMLRLQHEPELAARMGRKAAQRFEELFRAESMLSAYADLYRELL